MANDKQPMMSYS